MLNVLNLRCAQSVLNVERQVIGWFEPKTPEHFRPDAFPVWIVQDDHLGEGGEWYGFPAYDHPGMKLGKFSHLKGSTDPNLLEREVFPADEKVSSERVHSSAKVAVWRP